MRLGSLLKGLGLVIFIALLAACNQQPRPSNNSQQTEAVYFKHTVQFSGETLAMIAKWYTGNAYNWQAILDVNPGLDIKRIRIGEVISIPTNLMIRQTDMPKPTTAMAKESQSIQITVPAKNESQEAAPAPEQASNTITAPNEIIPPPSANDGSIPSDDSQKIPDAVLDGDNQAAKPADAPQGTEGGSGISSISNVFKKISGVSDSGNAAPAPNAAPAAPSGDNNPPAVDPAPDSNQGVNSAPSGDGHVKTRDELLKELTQDY